MGLIWAILMIIVVGAVVGVLARFLVPGRDDMGWGPTIILGIIGSLIGTLLGSLLGKSSGDTFIEMLRPHSAWQFIGAVIGGVIALLIWRAVGGRKTAV